MKKLLHAQSAVIKVGTESALQKGVMESVVDQMVRIRERVNKIYLVTSGAMALGRAKYGVKKRDDESNMQKRRFASAGQSKLMHMYEEYVEEKHGWIAHQILITRDLLSSDKECKKLLETLDDIFNQEIHGLPIFNENDAIADDELDTDKQTGRFADNDQLAGMLARLVRADALVLLTNVNGVRQVLKDHKTVIPEISIENQDQNRQFVVSDAHVNGNGKGGMSSKFDVSCHAATNGIYSIIGDAMDPRILDKIFITGENTGTIFLPH